MADSPWPRRVFLVAVAIHLAGLFLDRRLLPYTGPLALTALVVVAALRPPPSGPRSWTRPAALGGLALLAVTAAAVDARTAGYGWPTEIAAGTEGAPIFLEAALLSAAAGMLSAALLGTIARPARLRSYLPAAAALLVVGTLLVSTFAGATGSALRRQPAPGVVLAVLVVPAAAVLLLAAASGVAAFRRGTRLAGAGLIPLLLLGLSAAAAVATDDTLRPRDDETLRYWVQSHPYIGGPVTATDHALSGTILRLPNADVFTAIAPDGPGAADRAARPVVDLPGVAAAPSWSGDVWSERSDWARAAPALSAAALLLGLVAVTATLFPLHRRPQLPDF